MLFVESRTTESTIDQRLRLALLERLQEERGLVPLIRSTRLRCYETALTFAATSSALKCLFSFSFLTMRRALEGARAPESFTRRR
jgi:hypothetical protein